MSTKLNGTRFSRPGSRVPDAPAGDSYSVGKLPFPLEPNSRDA